MLDLGEHRRLRRDEPCRRLVARRHCLCDGSFVVVQEREVHGKTDTPFVLALVELVAGSEMDVGVLPRELEPERRLGGGIRRDRLVHVRALEERATASEIRGEIEERARVGVVRSGGEIHARERTRRHADRSRDLGLGLLDLRCRGGVLGDGLQEREAHRCRVRCGRGTGAEPRLDQVD